MPYLSALEVLSRRGAIQIHVYLYLYLYLGWAEPGLEPGRWIFLARPGVAPPLVIRSRVTCRNCGSDGAEESPSSTDAPLTDENTADDESWNETFRDSSIGDMALLREPPNYYEAVQYLRQVASYTLLVILVD